MAKPDDSLLTKLAKRKGITDPKGLAAWIKKHKKAKGIKDDDGPSLFDQLRGVVAEEDGGTLFDLVVAADLAESAPGDDLSETASLLDQVHDVVRGQTAHLAHE